MQSSWGLTRCPWPPGTVAKSEEQPLAPPEAPPAAPATPPAQHLAPNGSQATPSPARSYAAPASEPAPTSSIEVVAPAGESLSRGTDGALATAGELRQSLVARGSRHCILQLTAFHTSTDDFGFGESAFGSAGGPAPAAEADTAVKAGSEDPGAKQAPAHSQPSEDDWDMFFAERWATLCAPACTSLAQAQSLWDMVIFNSEYVINRMRIVQVLVRCRVSSGKLENKLPSAPMSEPSKPPTDQLTNAFGQLATARSAGR